MGVFGGRETGLWARQARVNMANVRLASPVALR